MIYFPYNESKGEIIIKIKSVLSSSIILTILLSKTSYSAQLEEIGFGIGMSSLSITESETSIEGENTTEKLSVSISLVTGNAYWKFLPKNDYSLFAEFFFPLVASEGNTLFGTSIGVEYYFSQDNGVIKEDSESFKLRMTPSLRYYLSGMVSSYYFSYATPSSVKNDIAVALSVGGGATYTVMEDFALKADLSIGRGQGVITSSIATRLFASIIYFWDR